MTVRQTSRCRRVLMIGLFNIAAIIVIFSAAEYMYRRYALSQAVFEEAKHMQYDEYLGWVPKPGKYKGGIFVTPGGFRNSHPENFVPSGNKVLVCGDSFTWCNEVRDSESWPYYLAEQTGWQITNSGVSGYGLDQIVLRMEKVISEIKPDLVIISLIYDDIARCELSKRTHYKPYFDIVNGEPILKNQPVPAPYSEPTESLKIYQHSLIIRDLIALISGKGHQSNVEIREHNQGTLIARYLFSRAQKIAQCYEAELLIVFLPQVAFPRGEVSKQIEDLTNMLKAQHIPVLDLLILMKNDYQGRESAREAMFRHHMTPQGNKWVASKVEEYIVELNIFQ